MLLTIESKFNIGDNVHGPKGERKVLGIKLDSKGILYLLESADGTREEDRINPWKNYFRRFRKQS